MSVIFDALKKLNKKEGDVEQVKSHDTVTQGNVIIFDDLLKKHAIASYLVIGVIICAVAAWLYFLYQYETTPQKGSVAPPIIQQTQRNPKTIFEEPTPEQTQQIAQEDSLEPPEEIIVSHLKPTPTNSNQIAPEPDDTDTEILFESDDTPPKEASITPRVNLPEQIAPDEELEFVFIPESNSTEPILQPDAYAKQTDVHMQQQPQDIPQEVYIDQQESPIATQQSGISVAIHTINQELSQAITRKDYASGQELLQELEQFLGPDSHYILNLKAYFYIQNKETEKAFATLSTILEDNKTELEAGLNMIVVLTQQGKIKQARNHVRFLLNYYPANPALLNFKQQLGS